MGVESEGTVSISQLSQHQRVTLDKILTKIDQHVGSASDANLVMVLTKAYGQLAGTITT